MKQLLLFGLAACIAAPVMAAEWRLVWSDEFNGKGLSDPAKWNYDEGVAYNHEAQFYTRERLENVRQENGNLIIEARKEQIKNAAYSSGRITTEGKATWRYGRVEVRAKLPTGRGTWPAIWMLGANTPQAGWPKGGEIDIMENVGFDPDTIHANIHTEKYNHVRKTNKGAQITVPKPYQDFHVYAVEWTPERMDFFVDDTRYFSYVNEHTGEDAWPYDQPFYLILNVAIGGDWGGQKGIDDTIFPVRMEVDYVRVYENPSGGK
jgi:beta-glucanase (GH16 family)